jgi:flavorubredoxin
VGKIDWELKEFHGSELSTHRGSSYNSYLIQEEKTVLIDTVWLPYAKEFVDNLDAEIGLENLDFVVQNHGEIDHSGALPELLRRRPDLPIYCTANAVKSLQGHFHGDWDFRPVKSGNSIDIGNGKSLNFISAPMLHWPDTMFTYLSGDALLFSSDAFGQHYASELLFNDLVGQGGLWEECVKYYANILTPFATQVAKKLNEMMALNLPLEIIAPSHGVIWRKDPMQVVTKYAEWAANYSEDKVSVLYDTMWDGTRRLAEKIAAGITAVSPSTDVRVHNLAKTDKNDVVTDVFCSKAVLVGSPTVNNGVLHSVAGMLELMEGLRFKGKKASSFGCFGWSGESPRRIAESLRESGFEIVDEGYTCTWEPDDAALERAFDYGKEFAGRI